MAAFAGSPAPSQQKSFEASLDGPPTQSQRSLFLNAPSEGEPPPTYSKPTLFADSPGEGEPQTHASIHSQRLSSFSDSPGEAPTNSRPSLFNDSRGELALEDHSPDEDHEPDEGHSSDEGDAAPVVPLSSVEATAPVAPLASVEASGFRVAMHVV